jgi:hypothetical protein
MIKRSAEDPRLTRLTEIALALPETARQIYGSHGQFLVRKKTFAYSVDNQGLVLPHGLEVPGRRGERLDLVSRVRLAKQALISALGLLGSNCVKLDHN